MDRQMGLLDRLAQMSGCVCLSDLRTPAYRRPVLDALGQISAEEYPAKEWLEAMGYLLAPMQEDGWRPGSVMPGDANHFARYCQELCAN